MSANESQILTSHSLSLGYKHKKEIEIKEEMERLHDNKNAISSKPPTYTLFPLSRPLSGLLPFYPFPFPSPLHLGNDGKDME